MKKTTWTVLGFLMFLFGFTSLILQMVGLQFVFMRWLDMCGPSWGFFFRLLLILAGLVIVYLMQTNWDAEA